MTPGHVAVLGRQGPLEAPAESRVNARAVAEPASQPLTTSCRPGEPWTEGVGVELQSTELVVRPAAQR